MLRDRENFDNKTCNTNMRMFQYYMFAQPSVIGTLLLYVSVHSLHKTNEICEAVFSKERFLFARTKNIMIIIIFAFVLLEHVSQCGNGRQGLNVQPLKVNNSGPVDRSRCVIL